MDLGLGLHQPIFPPIYSSESKTHKIKPNDWWPCGDYRALNSFTIPERYPLPHIHGCVSSLSPQSNSYAHVIRYRLCLKMSRKQSLQPHLARLNSSQWRSGYGMPSRPTNASSIVSCAVSTSLVPTLTTFSSPASCPTQFPVYLYRSLANVHKNAYI